MAEDVYLLWPKTVRKVSFHGCKMRFLRGAQEKRNSSVTPHVAITGLTLKNSCISVFSPEYSTYPLLVNTLYPMRTLSLLFILFIGINACDDESNSSDIPSKDGYTLVWNEEFDYNGLPDLKYWNYETGDHGWGNQELQNYVAQDAAASSVEDGMLTITASLQGSGQNQWYKSARLTTRGKAEFQYGYFEIRAKLPSGRGTWPAIWMLPDDISQVGWPLCGEIDIMEHVGFQPNVVHGTVHTGAFNHLEGTQRGGSTNVPNAISDFHVYAIDWTADKIDFYVNDDLYYTFNNTGNGVEEWPFNKPFFFILNIAIGGTWGGQQGVDPTIFPQDMEIDYIRVWEKN